MRLARVADRPSTDDSSSDCVAEPCWDSCSSALTHRLGDLTAGLGSLLVDDLAAFGTCLVADRRCLGACAGHRLVVVGLRGGDLFGRLAVVGSGFGQHGLAFGEHLADRRHDPLPDHAERDQEDEQHGEEGAVGNQEVTLSPALFRGDEGYGQLVSSPMS